MKIFTKYVASFAFLLLLAGSGHGQSMLSASPSGVIGFPDTVRYGDTLRNMTITVINDGPLPVLNNLITAESIFNGAGGVVQLGSLFIPTSNPVPVGDSVVIPLDDFVVSPQNSNNGSNIVVIWPTSPGNQTGDSLQNDYYVEDTPNSISQADLNANLTLFPNPCRDRLVFRLANTNNRVARLQIYSLQGRLVYAEAWPTEVVNTEPLPAGSYLIEMEDIYGQVYRRKFLRQ